MYGRNYVNQAAQAANPATVSNNLGTATSTQNANSTADSFAITPWLLASLLVMYIIWAAIEEHERVKEALEPANVAINIHNLGVIAIGVILSIGLTKILLTKMAAWGIPGSKQMLAVASIA